jgi:hypothetical protein
MNRINRLWVYVFIRSLNFGLAIRRGLIIAMVSFNFCRSDHLRHLTEICHQNKSRTFNQRNIKGHL